MQATATLRHARTSPRKVRVVLNQVRDQNVEIALAQLKFSERRAAKMVYKVLASAVANANLKFGASDPAQLFVKECYANEGRTLRRFRPRAMGRATRINKRTSHITVIVAEQD